MRKVFDAWLNLTQQALVDSISQVAEQTAIKASLPPQSAVPPRQPTGVPEFMRQWPARMIAPTPPKETPDTRTSRKEEYESFTTSLPTPKVQQSPAHPPPPAASPPVKEAAATSVDPKKEMPSPLGGEIKVHCYFTCGHFVCNWYNRGGKVGGKVWLWCISACGTLATCVVLYLFPCVLIQHFFPTAEVSAQVFPCEDVQC